MLEHLFITGSLLLLILLLAKLIEQRVEKNENYDFSDRNTKLKFYNLKEVEIGYHGFEGNRLILFNSAKVINQTFVITKGVYKVTVKDAEGQILIDIPHHESIYFHIENRKIISHIFLIKKVVTDKHLKIGFSTYKKGSFSGYSIEKIK